MATAVAIVGTSLKTSVPSMTILMSSFPVTITMAAWFSCISCMHKKKQQMRTIRAFPEAFPEDNAKHYCWSNAEFTEQIAEAVLCKAKADTTAEKNNL